MMIASRFDGDLDHELMGVQHDRYGEAVALIAFTCRASYLNAAMVLNSDDRMALALRPVRSFDHRALQSAHDHLAAHWRAETGQLLPMLKGLRDNEALARKWLVWLRDEIDNWRDDRPELVRTVCRVLVYQNTDPGYRAEDRLAFLLRRDYPLPGQKASDGPEPRRAQ